MKNLIFSGIIVLVVGLSAPQTSQAQGTTYASNLEQPSTVSAAVGSDSRLAAMFFTGTNSSGYFLNSFQLGMNDASGTPSSFTVMLYTAVGVTGLFPGSSLGSLSGSPDPATAGTYTYSAPSNLTLSQRTTYFIVLTAGTSVANGAYEWSLAGTSSYNPIGNWAATAFFHSSDGSSWSHISGVYPQLAINATPLVPEPAVSALLAFGGLCFLWLRRKAKTA
jgi:hypothetical protein